jgi:aquaporin Z
LTVGARDSLRQHWPEYLMEAWALGTFMVVAGVAATVLGSPLWPVRKTIPDAALRNVLAGIGMGLTAVAIIHSPWGKRSGAHMNPAVTVTFLRLGKTHPWDALFYIGAQTFGGTLGVLVVAGLLGAAFTQPPVTYAATLPGPGGPAAAFIAELAISGGLMFVLLAFAASTRLAGFTGIAAGCLVALYISVESPLSGMSMNPARSFASAAPAGLWRHFWIYISAPTVGMLMGAQLFLALRGARRLACGKLLHPAHVRCIHCGYEPTQR